jgi:hypothetical protein
MVTSTLLSSHTDGSGSGDSDSSGADVLGDGEALPVADVLGAGELADEDAVGEVLAVGVLSVADVLGDGEALSVDVSLTEALGEVDAGPSVA